MTVQNLSAQRAIYHERRLGYSFDSRSHERARSKPEPCGSARPRGRQSGIITRSRRSFISSSKAQARSNSMANVKWLARAMRSSSLPVYGTQSPLAIEPLRFLCCCAPPYARGRYVSRITAVVAVAAATAKISSRRGLFCRLLLLRAREALILFPAFGTFPSVVSAFVMSHKPDLRPLLEQEQSKRLG